MDKILLPWETQTFIDYPWGMLIMLLALSVPLTIFTLIRGRKK
jgi:hypothetical protein